MQLMASTNLPLYNHEDMYIDMELSCSSTRVFFSSPKARDFEFQTCDSTHYEKETITSPADELFYKGKLLPLHLPPRLEMVEKLFQTSTTKTFEDDQECSIVLPSTTNTTPLDQSCNNSPSESCRVSCELNPADYFEWSSELSGFISWTDQPKKSWSKYKLKLIKQSCLGQKLKASRAYLKSFFSKSGCSDESSAKATCKDEESENDTKGNKDDFSRYIKVARKAPCGQLVKGMKIPTLVSVMSSIEKDGIDQDHNTTTQRKSFSGTKQRIKSSTSCSSGASSLSSSFSFYSNGVYDSQPLKRSNTTTSEIESSIEAAIAYCKKSQQLFTTRNAVNEAGFCSFSVSRMVA